MNLSRTIPNTNAMLSVIVLYIRAQICIPHQVFSPCAASWIHLFFFFFLTQSDSVLMAVRRKSKTSICYEFTINIDHQDYICYVLFRWLANLSKYANGLLCAYKSKIYSPKFSSLADKHPTINKGWWAAGSISKHKHSWKTAASSIHLLIICYQHTLTDTGLVHPMMFRKHWIKSDNKC